MLVGRVSDPLFTDASPPRFAINIWMLACPVVDVDDWVWGPQLHPPNLQWLQFCVSLVMSANCVGVTVIECGLPPYTHIDDGYTHIYMLLRFQWQGSLGHFMIGILKLCVTRQRQMMVPPYTGGTFLTFQSLDCHLTDLILTCRDSFLQNLWFPPVSPPVSAKNPDHLYSLLNHHRTTANLSNHIFSERWLHTLSTDPQGWPWQRQIHTQRQIQRQRQRRPKFHCSSVNVYRLQCPLAQVLCPPGDKDKSKDKDK